MTLDNRRTIHRCLQIPELLAIIFEMVYSEPSGPATVALLARTARIFEDTALDILWRAQKTLIPLLKCFPVDMWEEKRDEGIRKLTLTRTPLKEDWTRVKAYAKRIRRLGHNPDLPSAPLVTVQTHPAGSVFVTLKECLGTDYLLPNLRKVLWFQLPWEETEDLAALKLMLCPKVSSMELIMHKWSDSCAEEVAASLRTFGSNPSQLHHINVTTGENAHIEKALLELCYRQHHLQEFNVSWHHDMSFDTVVHLSKLSNLKSVTIRVDEETSKRVLAHAETCGTFFPSLQTFSLVTDNLEMATAWLNTLRHPGLQNLSFEIDVPATASDLNDFFTKLTTHPSRLTLRHFRFACYRPCEIPVYSVLPDTLAPLFQLDLQSLKLEPGMPIDIDDDCVARIAEAWPRLQLLELGADWRRYMSPRTTLPGLVALARSCPDISALALPVDADPEMFVEAYEAGLRPTGGVSFPHCYSFGVGGSSVTTDTEMFLTAGFISDLCPDIMKLQTAWSRPCRARPGVVLDEEDETMGETWRTVEDYTREMARVRRQERGWLEIDEPFLYAMLPDGDELVTPEPTNQVIWVPAYGNAGEEDEEEDEEEDGGADGEEDGEEDEDGDGEEDEGEGLDRGDDADEGVAEGDGGNDDGGE